MWKWTGKGSFCARFRYSNVLNAVPTTKTAPPQQNWEDDSILSPQAIWLILTREFAIAVCVDEGGKQPDCSPEGGAGSRERECRSDR